ncbi:hypothetical protein [Paracidovorax cattleyae]|uniref:Uncharacterized protein n=1 Tax=Paracidovorax cattleyae TaxID=80868 RepID=A0A1H0WFM8_9BURK|nr:hypothetical protein [Paracidovorax cattleyae]SDP89530.1 hypothetical protein SAMN04489708_13835 [Paracidovorax cattleyae]
MQDTGSGEWPWSLDDHAQLFLRYHPAVRGETAFFMAESLEPTAGPGEFTTRLQAFLQWMAVRHRAFPQPPLPSRTAAG